MKKYLALTLLCPLLGIYAGNQTANDRLDVGLEQGVLQLVKQALNDGASVHKRDPFGRTPLINAAWHGREDIVALLLLRGADVGDRDNLQSTALHKAVRSGSTRAATLLISEGADLNAQDKDGRTPLHVATELNRPAMVQLLITSGADTTIRDNNGHTPQDEAKERQLTTTDKVFDDLKEILPRTPADNKKRTYGHVVALLRQQAQRA